MMEPLWDVILAGFSMFATLALSVLGYFVRQVVRNMENVGRAITQLDKDVGSYKLHVSEHYATKTDLTESRREMKESLDRLHYRIDEVGRDIKTLMAEK